MKYDDQGRLLISLGANAVFGPGASTDNAIARWDGVAGTQIQDSLVTINDAGVVTILAASLTIGVTTPTAAQWGYLGAAIQGIWLTVHKARAFHGGVAQAIPNAINTQVELDSEDYDPGLNFDTTNYRFTASLAGYYLVAGTVRYTTPGAAIPRQITIIYKNGVGQAYGEAEVGIAGTFPGGPVVDVFHLAIGEFVELYTYQNSGAPQNIQNSATGTFMCVHLLSQG